MQATIVIIIPSYRPPKEFPEFLHELRKKTDAIILVVDDGSGKKFYDRFSEATRVERCFLLRKSANGGKGSALRYAFAFAKDRFSAETLYITADCDGQHTPEDIIRMEDAIRRHPNALILGCRNFDEEGVPFRSRFGNKVSARLFSLFFGSYIRDTQTGLRAISHKYIPFLLALQGNGFDYEMRMLTECGKYHISIVCIDITTRYVRKKEDGECVSHFSPLRDSIRVLHVLCSSVTRYVISALLCALLDVTVFFLLEHFLFNENESARFVFIATLGARITSSLLNFLLNFKFVFREKSKNYVAKYCAVWMGRLTISYFMTLLARPFSGSTFSLTLIKGVVDLFLSFFTYKLLHSWVFVSEEKRNYT